MIMRKQKLRSSFERCDDLFVRITAPPPAREVRSVAHEAIECNLWLPAAIVAPASPARSPGVSAQSNVTHSQRKLQVVPVERTHSSGCLSPLSAHSPIAEFSSRSEKVMPVESISNSTSEPRIRLSSAGSVAGSSALVDLNGRGSGVWSSVRQYQDSDHADSETLLGHECIYHHNGLSDDVALRVPQPLTWVRRKKPTVVVPVGEAGSRG
jgi:hypothetical protein